LKIKPPVRVAKLRSNISNVAPLAESMLGTIPYITNAMKMPDEMQIGIRTNQGPYGWRERGTQSCLVRSGI